MVAAAGGAASPSERRRPPFAKRMSSRSQGSYASNHDSTASSTSFAGDNDSGNNSMRRAAQKSFKLSALSPDSSRTLLGDSMVSIRRSTDDSDDSDVGKEDDTTRGKDLVQLVEDEESSGSNTVPSGNNSLEAAFGDGDGEYSYEATLTGEERDAIRILRDDSHNTLQVSNLDKSDNPKNSNSNDEVQEMQDLHRFQDSLRSARSSESGLVRAVRKSQRVITIPDIDDRASSDSERSAKRPNLSTFRGSSSKVSIMSELKTVPDQKYWNRSVSWRDPRALIRKTRLLAGCVVENPTVQIIIIALIVINAIIMGVGTFDFVTENASVVETFDIVDKAFLSIFTVELILQLSYRGMSFFFDSWLVFDFVIVIVSWGFDSLQVIRSFRIFRAFRLITRIGPLRELIMAIGAVLPRMYAIFMLLLLVFYIYAVLFTQLFSELVLSENYFSSLDASLFTCMELMTLEWASITREVMEQEPWAWAPFLSFISITGFIVFNLIVAVVCDAVSVTDRKVKLEREGPEDNDTNKLKEARERIFELSGQVLIMKEQHTKLHQTMVSLTGALQQSLSLIHQLQPPEPEFKQGESDDEEYTVDVQDRITAIHDRITAETSQS